MDVEMDNHKKNQFQYLEQCFHRGLDHRYEPGHNHNQGIIEGRIGGPSCSTPLGQVDSVSSDLF